MAGKLKPWNPVPILLRAAYRNQARVSAAIRTAAPRVAHRGSWGPVGGSLARDARSRKLVDQGKAHVTTAWSRLGQVLTFFVRGTKRQKARKIRLHPKRNDLLREVEADAARHYAGLERRRRGE